MGEGEMKILACPACGAPANVQSANQDLTQPMHCEYCETVYTLRDSQDSAQKIMHAVQELRREHTAVLNQIAMKSSASGIDIGVRHQYFNATLYPSLKREVDQQLNGFEKTFGAPIVAVKAFMGLPGYQPHALLVGLAQRDNRWLKLSSVRVSIEQLEDYAVMPQDKLKLRELQFRVSSVVYLTNIVQHFTPATSSYQVIRQNLLALKEDYEKYAQNITDAAYRTYIQILAARMDAVGYLLELLISLLDGRQNLTAQDAQQRLGQILARLRWVQQQAAQCPYSPLWMVPLQEGIEKDLSVANLFETILSCYRATAETRPVAFGFFYAQLMDYVGSLATSQSDKQLLRLLQLVDRFLATRAGRGRLPVLADWSWLDAAVEGERHKSFFGGAREKSQVVLQHLHPYWLAKLSYTEEVSNFSGRRGVSREGFMLVDATASDAPLVELLRMNDPCISVIESRLGNPSPLPKQVAALPVLLSLDVAKKAMDKHTAQHASELGMTHLEIIGVIYLPAACVRYVGKDTSRDKVMGRLSSVNQQVGDVLQRTQYFLQQFTL